MNLDNTGYRNHEIQVAFISEKLKHDFNKLKQGKHEDKKLLEFLKRAIKDLKENPFSGTKVPKKLWPKIYVKKYQVTNLWKYDLPNSWRLIYTIETNEIKLVNILLEWFSHKGYEKRFGY